MESLGCNYHLSPKFVKFVRVRAKNMCKSAFEKYSFTNVGDFAERPRPSCNLHYVCVVLWRGRAKRPKKEGKRRWWEVGQECWIPNVIINHRL